MHTGGGNNCVQVFRMVIKDGLNMFQANPNEIEKMCREGNPRYGVLGGGTSENTAMEIYQNKNLGTGLTDNLQNTSKLATSKKFATVGKERGENIETRPHIAESCGGGGVRGPGSMGMSMKVPSGRW